MMKRLPLPQRLHRRHGDDTGKSGDTGATIGGPDSEPGGDRHKERHLEQADTTSVTFLPGGRRVRVNAGETLAEAALRAGMLFPQDCGGRGTCGKCRVQLVSGAVSPETEVERDHRRASRLRANEVLACQRRPGGHVVVMLDSGAAEVRSAAESGKGIDGQVPGAAAADRAKAVAPHIEKRCCALEPPSLDDQTPDWERLRQALQRDVAAAPEVIAALPALLRDHGFTATAVTLGDRLLAAEGGDTTAAAYGVALDVGTTTVAGYLADLKTGALLDSLAVTNRQASAGADVMTRIAYAMEHPGGLARLQEHAAASINDIVGTLLGRNGIAPARLYLLAAAGNTVMNHLLLGISPAALAQAPFIPAFRSRLTVPARRLGLAVPAHTRLLVLPNVASYVGSDITAAILATEMDRPGKTRLLIDIGTNGEIVLTHGERRAACSTAAGPAFEGAGVRCGMRAEEGAVAAVRMDDDVRLSVIGGDAPHGLCGSGLVDAVAELLRWGIVDRSGRICRPASCPSHVPVALRRRLRTEARGASFVLGDGEEGIALHQEDVRALQLAKGAMRAGIEILLARWGLTAADLDEVLLAGAFGSRLAARSVLRIGLLPPLPPEKIRAAGNAAGLGAWLALISRKQWDRAAEIAAATEHVELSGHPAFQTRFVEALGFPPGD